MFGLDRLAWAGLAAVALVLFGGFIDDRYGRNAMWRAHREAEDRAKNAVLTDMIDHETQIGQAEDIKLEAANKEFTKVAPTLPQCILTAETVQALNLIGD